MISNIPDMFFNYTTYNGMDEKGGECEERPELVMDLACLVANDSCSQLPGYAPSIWVGGGSPQSDPKMKAGVMGTPGVLVQVNLGFTLESL